MLKTSFSSFISKKPGEIPIFRTLFGEKLNFGLYFTVNRLYMGCLYFFGMYGKKRPIAIPWYQISIPQAVIFSNSQGKLAWLDEG